MGWPWTYFEWGPIWLPGIYDETYNPIWLRFIAIVVVMMWMRHFSEANIRYFYSKVKEKEIKRNFVKVTSFTCLYFIIYMSLEETRW